MAALKVVDVVDSSGHHLEPELVTSHSVLPKLAMHLGRPYSIFYTAL